MNYLRWRIFISDIAHHLFLLFAILLFLAAVFFSLLRLTLPLLPEHAALIESSLSELIGTSVSFDKMQVGWDHLQPEINLEGVHIWNDQHQAVMSIPLVDLRFSIFSSLLHGKPEISLLQVKQWQIDVYQNDTKQWQIAGIESLATNNIDKNKLPVEDFLFALLNIRHLKLQNCQIYIQPQGHYAVILNNTNLDWNYNNSRLNVYGNTLLQGPSNTTLQFASQFKGGRSDFLNKTSNGALYLKIDRLALAPWLTQQQWRNFSWQSGNVSGEVWAHWRARHWQQIFARMNLDDLNASQLSQKNPWGISSKQTKITLNWQQQKLKFTLTGVDGKLALGKIFPTFVPFEQIFLAGEWKKNNKIFPFEDAELTAVSSEAGLLKDDQSANQLSIQAASIKTKEVDLEAWLNLIWSDTIAPDLTLMAKANIHELQHALFKDMPSGILSPALVNWLDQAIVDGKNIQAEMLWRGPVTHFPFKDQSGTFQVAAKAQGITLDYAANWPMITDLDADLYFTSHMMHIVANKGLLGEIPISHVTADLQFQPKSHLLIHGALQTDLEKAWQFLTQSALKKTLSYLLTETTAKGSANLDLSLTVPLYTNNEGVTYQGNLALNNAELDLNNVPIEITQLSGPLSFSHQAIHGALNGNWLNEPWQLSLDRMPDAKKMQLKLSGKAPLNLWLPQYFKFAATWFTGNPQITGQVTIDTETKQLFDMTFSSNLNGVGIDLPMGIKKAAGMVTPVTLNQSNNDATNQLKLNWASPQGPVTAFHDHHSWLVAIPNASAKITEPVDNNGIWRIHLFGLDLRTMDTVFSNHIDLTDHLPSMDIAAEKIMLPNISLKALSLELRQLPNGTAIQHLFIDQGAFEITAQGQSTQAPESTYLMGKLTTTKLENTLSILGLGNLIDADATKINFNLSWPGMLWSFDRSHLSGQLALSTTEGVFRDISTQTNNKINLGRMLSILSINALPQHLSSHFNDMTQKGFPFTQLTGQLGLKPNQLNQININISSSVANVLLQGCVNLNKKQLNLVAQINPHVTGSLPFLATLAGGPILGAIGFVANQFLEPVIGKLGASYYWVHGNEQIPITDKVDQIKAAAALRNCN